MTVPIDPTLGRSQLWSTLRDARERARQTQGGVAQALGWSLSKVQRLEAERTAISAGDLRRLLAFYELDGDEAVVDEMVALAQRSRHQPWSRYRDVLNADYVSYLGYEDRAKRLLSFQLIAIPGMLQSRKYATALIESTSSDVDPAVTERRIAARLARCELLDQPERPEMTFLLTEVALHSWVGFPGDPEAMREQLEYLITLTDVAGLEIRVLPFSTGSHLGLASGFVILEFDGGHSDIVYRELARPAMILGDEAKIAPYKELFPRLEAVAEPAAGAIERALDALPSK